MRYSKTIEEELFNTPHSNPQTKKYIDKDFHHITHTHKITIRDLW